MQDENNNLSCDIFCKVIDNLGDVGVSFRLARSLQESKKFQNIRLWIDKLEALSQIRPEIDPSSEVQNFEKIKIIKWNFGQEKDKVKNVGEIIIEVFGCGLSDNFLKRMEEKSSKSQKIYPRWFNFEYLSAENWVPNFHLKQSPHPRYDLSSTYFFPGFTSNTGGLLLEKDLLEKRKEFLQLLNEQNLSSKSRRPKPFRISYFSYEIENLKSWLSIWGEQESPIHLSVAPTYLEGFTKGLGALQLRIGDRFQRGALAGIIENFCTQEEFDQRLWTCDLNFVRGEDSFIRALWSGNTFIWQPYPTKDRKHIQKLNAFLERYLAPFQDHERTILREFFLLWNGEVRSSRALTLLWKSFMRHRHSIAATAKSQSEEFARNHGNLIDKLIKAIGL